MENIIIGERLKEAREVRKLTQEELSRRVGITRASISAFEKELKFPSIQTVIAMANALNIPMAYLQNERPIRSAKVGPLSYRKKSRTSQAIQNQISRYEEWLEDIYSTFSNYIDFPATNIFTSEGLDFENLSDVDIENMADELRVSWGMGIGPISNITDFMEANGIIIGRAHLNSDIDAVSVWRSDRPHIIINKSIHSSVRIRMNLAHELGHLVLHKLATEEDYDDKEKHDIVEHQANYFAGCFLFPKKSFLKEYFSVNYNALIELKRRWKMSMSAIVMRGKNLDIVSDNMVESFYKHLGIKGYSRKNEPLDNVIPIEPIKLFLEASQMIAENRITLQRIIDETLLTNDDFHVITDIPFQKNSEMNVKVLQFRKRDDN